MKFYVYLHLKPSGDVFYVGKGSSNKSHSKRSHEFSGRNIFHTRTIQKYGKENIEILVFYRDSEIEAFETEIKWIKSLRDSGARLVNLTDGGEGACGNILSEETKKKMSESAKGVKKQPFTKEHKENLSKAKIGKKLSQHQIDQRTKGQTGLKRSEATRKKLSISVSLSLIGKKGRNTGKKHSDATKIKISESAKGRVVTQETRDKISKTLKMKSRHE